jgi:hypothetical protein
MKRKAGIGPFHPRSTDVMLRRIRSILHEIEVTKSSRKGSIPGIKGQAGRQQMAVPGRTRSFSLWAGGYPKPQATNMCDSKLFHETGAVSSSRLSAHRHPKGEYANVPQHVNHHCIGMEHKSARMSAATSMNWPHPAASWGRRRRPHRNGGKWVLPYSHETVAPHNCAYSLVSRRRFLLWPAGHQLRWRWTDSGDVAYHFSDGRISGKNLTG